MTLWNDFQKERGEKRQGGHSFRKMAGGSMPLDKIRGSENYSV